RRSSYDFHRSRGERTLHLCVKLIDRQHESRSVEFGRESRRPRLASLVAAFASTIEPGSKLAPKNRKEPGLTKPLHKGRLAYPQGRHRALTFPPLPKGTIYRFDDSPCDLSIQQKTKTDFLSISIPISTGESGEGIRLFRPEREPSNFDSRR